MAVEQNVVLPRLAAIEDVLKWARTLVDRLEMLLRPLAEAVSFGLIFDEVGVNPATPNLNNQVRIYMKSDKLVVHFFDGSASHYFTLDLTAVSNQSWVHSASAP